MSGTRESAILRGGTWEIITLRNREPGSPLNLYSLKKAKLPCVLFQGIAFHFYPHNAKVKFSPIKTPA